MADGVEFKLPSIKSSSRILDYDDQSIVTSPITSERNQIRLGSPPSSKGNAKHNGSEPNSPGKKKKVAIFLNESDSKNPFHVPTDEKLNEYKEELKEQKAQNKATNRKIHEKTTATFRNGTTRLRFSDIDEPKNATDSQKKHSQEEDEYSELLESPTHQHIARTLKYHNSKETENLNDFISKKREMFLLEYSLSVKREEIKKLDEIARQREEALRASEKSLEEDAARFDAFLKDNNLKTMEAKRRADSETKLKLEKEQEIKRLRNEIASLQNELAKYDEQLDDCRKYKEFLDRLTPPEFFTNQNKQKNRRGVDEDFEVEPMYFTDPQQLLDIFKQLEENNMFLIQNSQESERILEELRSKRRDTEEKMESEVKNLQQQIEALRIAIKREEQRTQNLLEKTSSEDSDDQEIKLDEFHMKVEEVYNKCIGNNDASIGTLQMLTKIERKMEELFASIDALPKEYVQNAEKIKEKERRQRLRAEKLELQKAAQESRIKRALERSQAPSKKQTGKPVMFRSVIAPKTNKEETHNEPVKQSDEDDDNSYFFSE